MSRTILLLLALSTPCFAQSTILSGTFEGTGGSPTAFVTADGTRHELPATAGQNLKLPPEMLKALPEFKAQVLFEKRGNDLVPVRLHSPQPYEGWVEVAAADQVSINGFDAKPTGPLWQYLWADELKGREVRVVGLRGMARDDGERLLHVLKVEATIKAASATLRRTDARGAKQTWLLTYGRRVWLQFPKSGRSELDPDGPPVLPVSDEDTPADQVSARPWGVRVTDVRIGQPTAGPATTTAGLSGSLRR